MTPVSRPLRERRLAALDEGNQMLGDNKRRGTIGRQGLITELIVGREGLKLYLAQRVVESKSDHLNVWDPITRLCVLLQNLLRRS